MLIKAVTAKGEAVPYSAEEALKFAVEYGVKKLNSNEVTFWVERPSITKEKFRAHNDQATGKWLEAFATGYCMIGKTCNKTDRFHQSKKHFFEIHYKMDKDAIGAPDLKVIDFQVKPLETNPAKTVGPVNTVQNAPLPVVSGEIIPEKTENAEEINPVVKPQTEAPKKSSAK